jgi:putative hydrolase of HD superfamily
MIADSLSFVSDICGALKTIKRTGWVRHSIPLPESDSDHMHRCAMCALLVTQPADPRDDYTRPDTCRFHPSRVDGARLLRMALTHDLCESLAGDVTPFCDPSLVSTKEAREGQAMRAIQNVVGDPLGEELFGLWREYEDQQTTEALLCKDIDKFEMVVQAYEYEKEHLLPRGEVAEADEEDAKAPVAENNDGAGSFNKDQGKSKDVRPDVRREPLRGFFVSTSSSMKSPLFRRLDGELRERREKMLHEKGWDITNAEKQQYTDANNGASD